MVIVRKAFTWAELLTIRKVLEANEFSYRYAREKGELDPFLNTDYTLAAYDVFVAETDLENAATVLNNYFENPVEEDSKENIKGMSNNGLLEVMLTDDVYTEDERREAVNELSRRGLKEDELIKTAAAKIKVDNAPQRAGDFDIAVGFLSILSLFGGIKTGYKLMYSKSRHTFTGESYYTYDEYSRRIGKVITLASITITILVIVSLLS